jgi:ClpP class serine protease
LEVDSSGGEAAGVFELASQINAFSKPIYGVANYQALSAGYLLLSATHEVFMPETGLVGSVGVVMYHMDASKALEKRGISYTPIFAGARKVDFSPHSPLSEEARAWAQDSVNRTYGHFVSAVADYRGIDGEGIKATEAGLLHADQALAARFANNIGTLGDTVQAMTDRVWNRTTSFSFSGNRATAQSAQTDERVSSMKEVTTAAPTGAATQASTIPAVAVDASQAQLDAAKAEGAKLERERITGILSLTEAKDRPKLAQHFANSGMSVDVARSALAVAAPEVEQASAADKSAFARHMEKQNVVVGATVPGQQANADTSKVIARIDTAGVYRTRADVMKRAADGR